MTKAQKMKTLLAILECSPVVQSMTAFESAARRGDLESFWTHYQTALRKSERHGKQRVASRDGISFEMLEPAMNAVYNLPTVD